jgi:hypothetical protein
MVADVSKILERSNPINDKFFILTRDGDASSASQLKPN